MSARRCPITKNINRGSIFSSRVGVGTNWRTIYIFKGSTCIESEKKVQSNRKGHHEEEEKGLFRVMG